MGKKFQIYFITFIFCLLTGFILDSGAAAASMEENQKQETASDGTDEDLEQSLDSGAEDKEQKQAKTSGNKKKKRGWVTLESGARKYFDKKGNYVTGLKKINGKTYSFNVHGHLQTDKWVSYNGFRYRTDSKGVIIRGEFVTINGKVYYLKKNGTVYTGWGKVNGQKAYFHSNGAMAVGLTEIDGKYYYFNTDGTMKTGTVEAAGITYYIAEDGVLEARKEKNVYYNSSNEKMTEVEALDFETLQRAKKIVSEITNSSMSQAQKLRKCFDWVMAKTYATRRRFTNAPGWIALYANDHFIYGSGNCQSDAAAFGYLAKALGCTEVYMCVDSKSSGHSWTEINGLVYDPLFAQAKSFSQNYGVRYGVYKLRAIQHVKI